MVAIIAMTRVQPAIPLRDNVVQVRTIPLWDWSPRRRCRPSEQTLVVLDVLRSEHRGALPRRGPGSYGSRQRPYAMPEAPILAVRRRRLARLLPTTRFTYLSRAQSHDATPNLGDPNA